MSLKKMIGFGIPKSVRNILSKRVRAFRHARERIILSWSMRSDVLAGFYYLVLNPALHREHRSVIAGKKRFAEDLLGPGHSSYRLRRNIHRLEKGLIMPERRPIFGLDYIVPTVEDFERVVSSFSTDTQASPELVWAHDVLDLYFSVVDLSNPRIAECFQRFQKTRVRFSTLPAALIDKQVPFARDLESNSIGIDQLYDLSRRRRSVRRFHKKPVDHSLVDKAVAVAAQSPSACNRQPFLFRVYDDPKMVKEISLLPAGAKGFGGELPAIAVVVGRLRAYPLERDRHIIYIDGSLAAMSFMFALETMGIGSCAINWADEEPAESKMADLLNLDPDERVVMLIGYGWPEESALVPRSTKRDLDEIREYNRL